MSTQPVQQILGTWEPVKSSVVYNKIRGEFERQFMTKKTPQNTPLSSIQDLPQRQIIQCALQWNNCSCLSVISSGPSEVNIRSPVPLISLSALKHTAN